MGVDGNKSTTWYTGVLFNSHGGGCRTVQTYKASSSYLKKNLNASRPSEHPSARGKNVKTFSRWGHRLQI